MGEFAASETGLTWKEKGQLLEVTAWGRDSLRIRATLNHRLADVPHALVSNQGTPARVELNSDGGRGTTCIIRLPLVDGGE